jgi:hypothetical protein
MRERKPDKEEEAEVVYRRNSDVNLILQDEWMTP